MLRFFQGGENEQTPTVVSKVAANTPASRASIREGDIILTINHIDIRRHSHEEVELNSARLVSF